MSGLGGLNKTPDGVVIGMVQLQLPTVTTQIGASSYTRQINQVMSYGADLTLLSAPPESASVIATEWTIGGCIQS